MDPRYMDTFLKLLSVVSYYLVLVLNKKVHSQPIFVNLFQMSELIFVEECFGTLVPFEI